MTFLLGQTSPAPIGHRSLTVHNGTGSSGDLSSGDTVSIAAEVPEEFEFVKWFQIQGDGTLSDPLQAEDSFTVASQDAVIAATFAKLESWFPPGPEAGNTTGLLSPKPETDPPVRREQRVRVRLNRGSSDKPSHAEIWDALEIRLQWENPGHARYFTQETEGDEIGSGSIIPKETFSATSEDTYEASIWYEGNLTRSQISELIQSGNSPEVGIKLNLVVGSTDRQGYWSGNLMPRPQNCCSCITLVAGKPAQGTDGNHTVAIHWSIPEHATCSGVAISEARLTQGSGQISGDLNGTRGTITVTITPEQAREHEGPWKLLVICGPESASGDPDSPGDSSTPERGCEVEFHLSGCSSGSCSDCNMSGEANLQNPGDGGDGGDSSFHITIPTTDGNGGTTSGNLSFISNDFGDFGPQGSFKFPGTNGLFFELPADFKVIGDGGGGTLIDTNAAILRIEEPHADTISITHEYPAGTVFRTTTISYLKQEGILRMDTALAGEPVTRYQQTRPAPGKFVIERGRVINGGFVPLRRETVLQSEPSPIHRIRTLTVEERPNDTSGWFILSVVQTTLENQFRGWVRTAEVIDPDRLPDHIGEKLTSTWEYYQPGEISGPQNTTEGLSRLKRHRRYDGYEEHHTYATHYHQVFTPYTSDPAGKSTTHIWNPATRTRTVTVTVGGEVLSKTKTIHTDTSVTRIVHTAQGNTLTTRTTFSDSGKPFGGQPIRTEHPDGTLTTYSYQFTADGGLKTTTTQGSTQNSQTVDQGTRTTTETDSRGRTILRETRPVGHGAADAAVLDGMEVIETEAVLGRATKTRWQPGNIITTTAYSCCGVSMETDRHGIPTYHTYDPLKRRVKSTRLGVTTETVYQGLTTDTHRYPAAQSASSATLVSRSTRNLAGTEQESLTPDPSSSDPEDLVATTTATTYTPGTGLSRRTITTVPGGHTQTTDTFLDGRTAKTSGDLSPAMEYAYSVNPTGELTSASFLNTENLKLETSTTQTDWAGRTVQTAKGPIVTQYTYFPSNAPRGSRGQLASNSDADGVTTRYAYNARGERTTTAIDLNGNNAINHGTDTVQYSETLPALRGTSPVWRTTRKVWKDGDTNAEGGTVVSITDQSPDGLQSWTSTLGTGGETSTLTTLQGDGNWTTTQTNPDGTKQIQTYTAGLLVSTSSLNTENFTLANSSYGYDPLNRPTQTTDSRTGTTTTEYMSATNDAVKSITDPGNRTTAFTYDNCGRQTAVKLPDETVTTTTYNPRGEVSGRSGSQTYPVTYTYDYAGRQKTMTTYGTEEATTTWIYDPATGFLVEKNYHGENDDGVTNRDYTYTPAGRLRTRTWQRGVTTTYGYDSGGRLASVTYSNETNGHTTPNLAYTYDALGRIHEVTRGGVLHAKYTYRSSDLQRLAEIQQIDSLNQTVTYTYEDGTNGTLQGRPNGFTFADGGATWTYDAAGRLSTVAGVSNSGFQYTYEPGSAYLVSTLTGPAHTVTNEWEPTRDVLASKQNDLPGGPLSKFAYSVNNLGQRVGLTPTGSAFANNTPFVWAYNPRGELTSATRNGLTAFERAYSYDGIGNRLSSEISNHQISNPAGPNTTTYTPNALNQYSAIENPQSSIVNPTHDADGNLTSGPVPGPSGLSAGVPAPANATLTWDAENRLVEAVVGSVTIAYAYDHQSRLIAATVGGVTTRYLYDGWNRIAEYQQNGTGHELKRSYLWGMDMSGSTQGAGGVGGLLAMTVHDTTTTTFYPTYDGNGNVSEYINQSGTDVAHFEYDPFGNLTVDRDGNANQFPYRFSTKPQDLTTGLLYYGYRWYDPLTGRWPSRDPIEEEGGINLYGFVGNDGVSWIDVLGLESNDFADAEILRNWLSNISDTGESSNSNPDYCELLIELFFSYESRVVLDPWDPRNPPQQFALYRVQTGGWIDQWGQHHTGICMACHANTPEAQRNKNGILAGSTGWSIFYTDVVLTVTPSRGGTTFSSISRSFSATKKGLTSSVGSLRARRLADAHHVIQDAAVRDLPGYSSRVAPGVQLRGPSTAAGSPHYRATQVQRQAGGGTYAAERRIGYKALRRAGYSETDARRIIEEADTYFRSIGVTPSTPTRIPGNRTN